MAADDLQPFTTLQIDPALLPLREFLLAQSEDGNALEMDGPTIEERRQEILLTNSVATHLNPDIIPVGFA